MTPRSALLRATLLSSLLAAGADVPGIAATPAHEHAASAGVEVVGLDYAFNMPRELPPGRTTFRFVNRGKRRHEFNIVLLKPGTTIEQYVTAANADQPVSPLVDGPVGVLFAGPGGASAAALSTELLAGRTYAVVCIFRDTAKAPRHHALGMYAAIHVTSAKPAPTTPIRVDTITGLDYAFRYPRTLAPGVHYFAFVNAGKQRHEVALALLKAGVTIEKVLAVEKADGDVDALFDQDLGLLHARGGTTPLGLLRVELLAGRDYAFECGFSDTPTSPPHAALGMYGSLHVSGAPARR